jgi:heme/copper-type cytochrome/quinol oxidase subunit 4
MEITALLWLQADLIALFTPRKLIAYAIVLVIVIAGVVWWMGRSRGRGTP